MLKKKAQREMSSSSDMDKIKVLAVDEDNYVILYNPEEDNVVVVHRSDWTVVYTKSLDLKRDYFQRYNHFCGVALVQFTGESMGTVEMHDKQEDGWVATRDVDILACSNIQIEMEHG